MKLAELIQYLRDVELGLRTRPLDVLLPAVPAAVPVCPVECCPQPTGQRHRVSGRPIVHVEQARLLVQHVVVHTDHFKPVLPQGGAVERCAG